MKVKIQIEYEKLFNNTPPPDIKLEFSGDLDIYEWFDMFCKILILIGFPPAVIYNELTNYIDTAEEGGDVFLAYIFTKEKEDDNKEKPNKNLADKKI